MLLKTKVVDIANYGDRTNGFSTKLHHSYALFNIKIGAEFEETRPNSTPIAFTLVWIVDSKRVL
jgi:hypothetical protein